MQNSRLTTHGLQLNIICFDVPLPSDYGGAIEEFYKIKSLHQLGIKIHLHCFVYGDRIPEKALEHYCENVYYYKRERKFKYVLSALPFIVKSRMNKELLQNLQSNDFPVLFDATHTTGFIEAAELKNRIKVVRLHNIEWMYYHILFHSAYTLKEKLFYFFEYKKLKKYDNKLQNADILSCLSETDYEYYSEKFPNVKVYLDYVFHENEELKCKTGKGKYILYHGNLSLTDNYQLIIDVLANELAACSYPIIIAGKNPDKILVDFIKNKPLIQLIQNPGKEQLNDLIENAHICLAMAKNPSGVKLKLINSLFKTRFVISDNHALHGSGLEYLCIVHQPEMDLNAKVHELMQQEFTQDLIEERRKVLLRKYNNSENASQLLNHIFTNEK